VLNLPLLGVLNKTRPYERMLCNKTHLNFLFCDIEVRGYEADFDMVLRNTSDDFNVQPPSCLLRGRILSNQSTVAETQGKS